MERKAGTLHAQRQAAIMYELTKPALALVTIVAVTSTGHTCHVVLRQVELLKLSESRPRRWQRPYKPAAVKAILLEDSFVW
jgi:hypothetical protein